jgi:hypothetical protein
MLVKMAKYEDLTNCTFTSDKIKTMFELMSECAANFTDFLSKLPVEKNVTEIKNNLNRYLNAREKNFLYIIIYKNFYLGLLFF